MPTTKNQASSPRLRLLRQIRQLAQGPFKDPYLRLIAGVEIRTAVATMVVPSTVHTYISITEEQLEKLPATMCPKL